jgi:hypothetical protein
MELGNYLRWENGGELGYGKKGTCFNKFKLFLMKMKEKFIPAIFLLGCHKFR